MALFRSRKSFCRKGRRGSNRSIIDYAARTNFFASRFPFEKIFIVLYTILPRAKRAWRKKQEHQPTVIPLFRRNNFQRSSSAQLATAFLFHYFFDPTFGNLQPTTNQQQHALVFRRSGLDGCRFQLGAFPAQCSSNCKCAFWCG